MELKDTLRTIYNRRSVRMFKDKPVEHWLIDDILDAGRMAPSAINIQPWKFYILTKEKDIQEFSHAIRKVSSKQVLKMKLRALVKSVISAVKPSHGEDFTREKGPVFHGAPTVIFITADKNNKCASLEIGLCAQNMMLAADSMGLDSCPIGFTKYAENTEIYHKLNISNSEKVMLAVIVGYGDEVVDAPKKILDNASYMKMAGNFKLTKLYRRHGIR